MGIQEEQKHKIISVNYIAFTWKILSGAYCHNGTLF